MNLSFTRKLASGFSILAALAGGFWAGRVTLAGAIPPEPVPPELVTTQVTEASVGRTLNLMTTVTQPFTQVAINSLSGIVTEVATTGEISSGDLLFVVAGQPVYAIGGELPFFRVLSSGTSGVDVAQLQYALAEWGFSTPITGTFGAQTTNAVQAWQTATGQQRTGTIQLGTLLAIPELPGTVRLGDGIITGRQLIGGEPAVFARIGEPQFQMNVTQDQANMISTGVPVTIRNRDAIWAAYVANASQDELGNVTLDLQAPDGGLVCGDQCDLLGGAERNNLMSEVHVVPEVSGPALPVAAIRLDATGASYAIRADGTTLPISILASSDGLAIIENVPVGTEVVLFSNP